MKEILTNHGGCNPKKYNKKKGYTLIEIVAVIAISAIAMIIGITIIINSYTNYIKIRNDGIRADEIDNGLLNIDRLLTDYMIIEINPSKEEKKIEIKYLINHNETIFNRKIIKFKGGNLVVETHNSEMVNSLLNTMPILRGVEDFIIIQKENLYYYKIILKAGGELINCI